MNRLEKENHDLKCRLTGLVNACVNVNINDSIANERYKGKFIQALRDAKTLLEYIEYNNKLVG